MNWYVLELEVTRRKEESQVIASLASQSTARRQADGLALHHRILVTVGAMLITFGTRLQAGYLQMAEAAPERGEPLAFSSNGTGPGPC
jgi:hypothetical protein